MQLTMATKKIAPSRMSAAKTIFATFQILKDEGGQLAGRQVIERIRNTIEFTDWEREIIHFQIQIPITSFQMPVKILRLWKIQQFY